MDLTGRAAGNRSEICKKSEKNPIKQAFRLRVLPAKSQRFQQVKTFFLMGIHIADYLSYTVTPLYLKSSYSIKSRQTPGFDQADPAIL